MLLIIRELEAKILCRATLLLSCIQGAVKHIFKLFSDELLWMIWTCLKESFLASSLVLKSIKYTLAKEQHICLVHSCGHFRKCPHYWCFQQGRSQPGQALKPGQDSSVPLTQGPFQKHWCHQWSMSKCKLERSIWSVLLPLVKHKALLWWILRCN